MSFIQAFLDNGRERGEKLEQMDRLRKDTLQRFIADMEEIAELFNTTLGRDGKHRMEVLPMAEDKTGVAFDIPDRTSEDALQNIKIDVSFAPSTKEYTIGLRDKPEDAKALSETGMKAEIAALILKPLADDVYLKFYRALANNPSSQSTDSSSSPTPDTLEHDDSGEDEEETGSQSDDAGENGFTGEDANPPLSMHMSTDVVMR